DRSVGGDSSGRDDLARDEQRAYVGWIERNVVRGVKELLEAQGRWASGSVREARLVAPVRHRHDGEGRNRRDGGCRHHRRRAAARRERDKARRPEGEAHVHWTGNSERMSSMAMSRATCERTGSPSSPLARNSTWFPSARRALSICACSGPSEPWRRATSTMLPSHD